MKVKDLVDFVSCEVIIERFTGASFFNGVLDNCPENILEYHVTYLLPKSEDVLIIRIS